MGPHRFRIVAYFAIAVLTISLLYTSLRDEKDVEGPPETNIATATAESTPVRLGVYRGDAPRGPGKVDAYSAWLGRQVDLAEAFAPGDTWDDVEGRSWQLGSWSAWVSARPGRRLVLTVPILPGPVDGRGPTKGSGAGEPVSLERGAAGAYDAHFVTLARRLTAHQLGESTLRLGHEFNGAWYTWRAKGKEAAFAAYWRRIVSAMRSVPGHNLQFDWNPSVGYLGMRPELAWPGDAYVDTVGVNVYDQSWSAGTYPVPSDASVDEKRRRRQLVWSQILDGIYGLRFWQSFAVQHSKHLSIPEWALTSRHDGRGGGDNPEFIASMWRFIQDPANRVVYHVYFDYMAGDGGHQLSSHEGFATPFPAAASAYKQLVAQDASPLSVADIRLRVSKRSTRAKAQLLSNRTLPTQAFVFVAARSPIVRVAFYIDDPQRRRRPFRIDSEGPFDLAGGSSRIARAFPAAQLRPGKHRMTVAVRLADGRLAVAHTTFFRAGR